MLPTFVIGLREGLEAALIVGIVAAFLRQRGRSDLLRWVFAGIAAAIGLCVAAGVALEIVSRDLPQRQQEGLETVIGAFAVVMVSYMVVWMRRHSRDLKRQLEGAAGIALAQGSGWALVVMAFLAVLREGLETVVFLLAAFNETGSGRSAGIGATLGILVAVGLGWGIYRGGIRLNLSKFFRLTGAVLVLVAAGLVLTALHTAHEAGWLNVGQQSTVNLSGVVSPGSLQSSILTGMLGLQPRPVLIEVLGWLLYLVPMLLYVTWTPGRTPSRAALAKLAVSGAVVCLVGTGALIALRPAEPAQGQVSRSAGLSAQLLSVAGRQAVIRATLPTGTTSLRAGFPVAATPGAPSTREITATLSGTAQHDGLTVDVYTANHSAPITDGPPQLGLSTLAQVNGGRLPLGVRAKAGSSVVSAQYQAADRETFDVARQTGAVVDVQWQQTVTVLAHAAVGIVPINAGTTTAGYTTKDAAAAARTALAAHRATDRRHLLGLLAALAGGLGGALLIAAASLAATRRQAPVRSVRVAPQVAEPVRS